MDKLSGKKEVFWIGALFFIGTYPLVSYFLFGETLSSDIDHLIHFEFRRYATIFFNQHGFSFWNPFFLTGIPWLGQDNVYNPLFSIFTPLFFLFNPKLAYTLQVQIQISLLALSLYVYLRRSCSPASAFSGALIMQLGSLYGKFYVLASWMLPLSLAPLYLIWLEDLHKKESVLKSALASLGLCCMILTSSGAAVAYFLTFIFLYAGYLYFEQWQRSWKPFCELIFVCIIGLGLAAVKLVPLIDTARTQVRASVQVDDGYLPMNLVEMILPYPFLIRGENFVWAQPLPISSWFFIDVLALPFAIVALKVKRNFFTWFLPVFLIVEITWGMFPGLHKALFSLLYFYTIDKFIVYYYLCGSIVIGRMLEHFASESIKTPGWLISYFKIVFLIYFAALMGMIAATFLISYKEALPFKSHISRLFLFQNSIAPNLLFSFKYGWPHMLLYGALAFQSLFAILWLQKRKKHLLLSMVAGLGIAHIVMVSLSVASTTMIDKSVFAQTPEKKFLTEVKDNSRIAVHSGFEKYIEGNVDVGNLHNHNASIAQRMASLIKSDNYPEVATLNKYLIFSMNPQAMGIGNIGGALSFHPRYLTDILGIIEGFDPFKPDYRFVGLQGNAAYPTVIQVRDVDNTLLDFMGVNYLFSCWDIKSDNWEFIMKGKYYNIYKNKFANPRAFVADQIYNCETDRQCLRSMMEASPEKNKGAVYLHEKAYSELHSNKESSGGTVEWIENQADLLRLKVTAQKPSFLVLSDTYDPKWAADVDGQPAKIERVNYAFRGIYIPSGGEHTVAMVYKNNSLKTGVIISLMALALLCVRTIIKKK